MEIEVKYKYSKAYYKILDLIQSNPNEDVFVIRGGQGASKTVSIIQLIIQSLISSEKEAAVLSSELSKMKRTVIRDYKKICRDWGVLDKNDSSFNISESKHEYNNGSILDFLGSDVNDVGKGFRRDILYINEADKMHIDSAVQFISRASLTIIDYNPDKLFWGDDYINDNNFLTLTYRDNEYLSKSEVRSIEDYKVKGFIDSSLSKDLLFNEDNIKSNYWANKYKVYGLGMVGQLDGIVFDNYEIVKEIPKGARLLGYGLDFGYTNDPTSVVALYKINDTILFDEVLYQKGLTNKDIYDKLGLDRMSYLIADSAEPKSIEELRRLGLRIYPCTKGKDSINFGIELIQNYRFLVTESSTNIITELRRYMWDTDKTGKTLNKPIDDYNHAIDAMRYICTDKLKTKTNRSGAFHQSSYH